MAPTQRESGDCLDIGEASFVKLMGDLVEIKGYRAAAIMSCQGELLYSNTSGATNRKNFNLMLGCLNEFFDFACLQTEKTGFDSCGEVSLRTDGEILVIRCSGKDCLVGIRMVVSIENQGNLALLQRRLEQLFPKIMKCLVWEPDNLVHLFLKEAKPGNEGTKSASLTGH